MGVCWQVILLLVPTAFESIATVSVGGGGAPDVEFTSIPATYTHLQIRGITRAATHGTMWARFNGVSTSSYSWHYVEGDGASPNTDAMVFLILECLWVALT
jgi:hypothetical protein